MLKLVSVNIEGDKYLDKIINLIERINPDVVCMQEVFENDASDFARKFGMKHIFSPMANETNDGKYSKFGIAIFSKLPILSETENYYYGVKNELPPFEASYGNLEWMKYGMSLTSVVVGLPAGRQGKDKEEFTVATTHFLKSTTEGGMANDFQRNNVKKLLDAMERLGSFVLGGDFNAPRGMEIFDTISSKYKDNVDPKYTRSLDPDLHRRPDLELMVDGLFTTPEYEVAHMHFETGVSDHYAIVAEVEKVK